MKTTTNHALKKPDGTDTVNIEDLNYNADTLDALLVPATTTTDGLMSSADKTKLNGIATGANKYTHPATHPASMISGLSTVATSGSYNDLLNKPSSFTPASHTHDDRYYTETEINTKLNAKANASHTHDYLPIAGGSVTGNLLVGGTTDLVGNVGLNGALYMKIGGVATDVGALLDSLNTRVSNGNIKSVQRGWINNPAASQTAVVSISSVNAAKCIVILNGAGAENVSNFSGGYMPTLVSLTNTSFTYSMFNETTWGKNKYAALSWQVIEFY